MIIYIHGFGSNGLGNKVKILKEFFKKDNFIAPTLSHIPELAIETLKELIIEFQKNEKVYLIGSSLGGYYTIYLSNLFNILGVLINPAINPIASLSSRKEIFHTNFYDNSKYEFNSKHISSLE